MIKKTMMLFLAAALLSGAARAGEIDILVNKLAEKGIITYTEAARIISQSDERIRTLNAAGMNYNLPLWIQTMSLKGDVRVRGQIDYNHASGEERDRFRTRVRLGFETIPIEKVKIGAGIATGAFSGTGDKNPNSTNHTYEAFNKGPLFLDYAFIQYNPLINLTVSGGKVRNKTQVWNPSDLIWDTDINPDGMAVNYRTVNPEWNFFANAGWYVIGERNDSKPGGAQMPYAYIIQPGVSYVDMEQKKSFKAAAAYQDFELQGRYTGSNDTGAGAYLGGNQRNDNNYRIINPSIEFKFMQIDGDYTLNIFGDYAYNIYDSVFSNSRQAYLFGTGFGYDKLEAFMQWNIKGMYRYLGENAVPPKLGDSDSYDGLPGKGAVIKFGLGLTRNLQFNANYFNMTDLNSQNRKTVWQFDAVYTF